jgi:selenocysteine-specific elongation factor
VTQAALARLLEDHEIAQPLPDRWLALKKWHGALETIEREVRGYADKYPSRFGYLKGELKSGLKVAMEGTLFDIAFHALEEEGRLEVRSQRVRPADSPWEPPAATVAALVKLEAELEATGMSVPDALQWQGKLGSTAAEVAALGLFLERLVRVNQELIYTSRQMDSLRAKLAEHFAKKPALLMAEFKEMAGVSRKYAVPLLEHCDRVGWTVRAGDERKKGGRLAIST